MYPSAEVQCFAAVNINDAIFELACDSASVAAIISTVFCSEICPEVITLSLCLFAVVPNN